MPKGYFSKKKKESAMNKKSNDYKNQVYSLEEVFKKFNSNMKYSKTN
jgi:hypothetical protein